MFQSKHSIEQHCALTKFGSTDMLVCPLGFGGLEIDDSSLEQVSSLLNQALDAGLNVIDTAECYGRSEELIGQAVGKRRSEYYLFTKCGHGDGYDLPDWHPQVLTMSIERSLKRLRTDYIDLLQLHSCPRTYLQHDEVITILQKARAAGKIRYIGYSGDRADALYAISTGYFDTLQTTVNIADQEAIELVIPVARARGMGIIAKHSLANAAWNAPQLPYEPTRFAYWQRLRKLDYAFLAQEKTAASTALRFILNVSGVNVVLVGTSRPERYLYNLAALQQGPLPQEQYAAIRTRWNSLTRWRKHLPGSKFGWHARV